MRTVPETITQIPKVKRYSTLCHFGDAREEEQENSKQAICAASNSESQGPARDWDDARADGGRNQAISYVRRAMRLREVLISRALREVEETEEHEGTMMQRRQGQRSLWAGCYVGDGWLLASRRPCHSTTASSKLTLLPHAALRNTWMDVGGFHEIHPSTSIHIHPSPLGV
jgi:hypothetical protein